MIKLTRFEAGFGLTMLLLGIMIGVFIVHCIINGGYL